MNSIVTRVVQCGCGQARSDKCVEVKSFTSPHCTVVLLYYYNSSKLSSTASHHSHLHPTGVVSVAALSVGSAESMTVNEMPLLCWLEYVVVTKPC